ncbi:MAG TPA: TolC family protein, partial [bacterium]|nr:TolC family protein [bacterium]
SVKAAKNQLRPQLDLSMGAWSSGLGDHADDSLDLMKDGDFTSYTVGLTLTYPLGNRAARARMQRSELQAEAARTSLEDQLRGVDLQVRAAIRQIETNQQRVDATTISVDLAEERLRAEEEALQVGLSTSHDVLDYQEDLTIARGSYTQSVIDHILSIAQLELSKGTLTQWLGFKVEE